MSTYQRENNLIKENLTTVRFENRVKSHSWEWTGDIGWKKYTDVGIYFTISWLFRIIHFWNTGVQ